MNRRGFLGGLAVGTLAAADAISAQPARKPHRIGVLIHAAPAEAGPAVGGASVAALVRGLRELDYIRGEHFLIEFRAGEDKPARYPVLAAELARLQVDVIVGSGPTISALKQATSTIPIVMAAGGDPVGDGIVQSLAHPGGNITGLSHQMVDATPKRLEVLKEIVPTASPVAVLLERGYARAWQAAETAARQRGWKLLPIEILDPGEIDAAFRAASTARAGAILVTTAGLLFSRARHVAELAARHRLPAMYPHRRYVEAGGLIAYSADLDHVWWRAAYFVDKILKGARPGNLPIEQPTKFELGINLRTAKALGITVPPPLLLRADHVIE